MEQNKKKSDLTHKEHDKTTDLEEELRALRKENLRLRKSITALKKELKQTRECTLFEERRTSDAMLQKQAARGRLFGAKSYFSFLYRAFRHSFLFRLYKRIFTFLRRFRFLTYTLALVSYLLIILEASAALVLSTSFFLFAIPLSFLATQGFVLLTRTARRKANEQNAVLFRGKRLAVFFPPRRGLSKSRYFVGLVKDFAADEHTVAIVVSPYILSGRGMDRKRGFFLIQRTDGARILLVRRPYYFSMKKHLFKSVPSSIIEIF